MRLDVLRLTDVLRSTGLSRAALYNRIAKGEFPHQISLGGRSVEWLKAEIDNWINERIRLRSGPAREFSETTSNQENAVLNRHRSGQPGVERFPDRVNCTISVNEGSPDPAELSLVSTKLYFDRTTGSFWLKLLPEEVEDHARHTPRVRTRQSQP